MLIMKKIFILVVICLIGPTLLAHEFWLEPEKFIYQPGDNIVVRFKVGEDFHGENWKDNGSIIQNLMVYQGDVEDNLSEIFTKSPCDSLEFSCFEEGMQMIAYSSIIAQRKTEAEKFNQFLKAKGLQDVLTYRLEHNQTDSAGKEQYQSCIKTMIQVGSLFDETFSRPTNLLVDIIPAKNPYSLKSGDSLTLKLLFKSKAMVNSQVRIWHREDEMSTRLEIRTDSLGQVTFPVTTSGVWMVSVLKMLRLEAPGKADWQSFDGSLTWGYQR